MPKSVVVAVRQSVIFQHNINQFKTNFMNATELRIGNLFIEQSSKEIISVIGLEKNRVVFSGMFLDKWQAEPIEITEDWLCKLGFNKSGGTYELIDGLIELVFHKGEIFEVIEEQWKSFNHIKHIHQLQNLYFALTGRELTVC